MLARSAGTLAVVVVGIGLMIVATHTGRISNPGGAAVVPAAAPTEAQLIEREYHDRIAPLLGRYCFNCHTSEISKGDIALDRAASHEQVKAQRDTWQAVTEMLDYRFMPPEDQPQPSQAEIDTINQWVQRALWHAECDGEPRPGRVTIRRLNRNEYNATIRDLVGVDFQPADDFPADDTGYGFDNIGDVLSVSPLHLEKYLSAAEQVVARAIQTQPPAQRETIRKPLASLPATRGSSAQAGGRFFYSNGEAYDEFNAPITGTYIITTRAWAQQAGDEKAKLALTIDNKPEKTFTVSATSEEKMDTLKREVKLTEGRHRIAVGFVNDYYQPKEKDKSKRDRNLFIKWLTIDGPIDAPPPIKPATHQRIVIVEPSDALDHTDAARRVIGAFARRAFRRPVAADEVDRLLALYQSSRDAGGNYEEAIALAVTAALVSPHFLYKVELDPADAEPGGVYTLEPYALASRLSYFLWSSMPDDELFSLAEQGLLADPAVLREQVARMLADEKADGLVKHFAGQWLELRSLDDFQPDADRYPKFDDALRAAMRREGELLFAHVARNNRPIVELIDPGYTYVNEALAAHYGLTMPDAEQGRTEDGFAYIDLTGAQLGQRRGGVLTLGAVLAVTSNPTRTSPVKRGKWVLENILGAPPPPAPPDVPELDESDEAEAGGTLKQRLIAHRTNPDCAVCHVRMDPIGFAMENYDPVGRWRDFDGSHLVDPTSELADGTPLAGAADLKAAIVARQPEFARAFTERLLTYALGRGLTYHDRCAVNDILDAAGGDGFRFGDLVEAIVTSDPFLKRRAAGEPAPDDRKNPGAIP